MIIQNTFIGRDQMEEEQKESIPFHKEIRERNF